MSLVHAVVMFDGDLDLAAEHFAALEAYFDSLQATYDAGGGGLATFATRFDDVCPPPPQQQGNAHLIGAFADVHDATLIADIAAQLSGAGRLAPDAAAAYGALRDRLIAEYGDAFVLDRAAGRFGESGMQTEQALPLWLDAAAATTNTSDDGDSGSGLAACALEVLVSDIVTTQQAHSTSRIIGIKYYALETLGAHGCADVRLSLMLQTSYPSFGPVSVSRSRLYRDLMVTVAAV